jgi:hypothetical protein
MKKYYYPSQYNPPISSKKLSFFTIFTKTPKMKKSILFCLMLGIMQFGFSQAPQGIPYQAVARNAQGNPMANQSLTVQFSLHEASADGQIVFQETQTTTTNGQGLFSLTFGVGVPSIGTFAGINWGSGYKFLQVQADFGNGYVEFGTQQLMSVPYALYAGNTNSTNNNSLFPGSIGKGITSISNATNTGDLPGNINFCFNLEESGFTDWRLPTVEEVLELYTNNGINSLNETVMTISQANSVSNSGFSGIFIPFIYFQFGQASYTSSNTPRLTYCVR